MDEGCNKAVTEVFCKMHEKGYIYKGSRIVNWCPVCNTSISDAEVEYEDQAGHFWHIKYPILNEDGTQSGEYLTFATTRPETMLGDTAVAIHPDDERYTHLKGRKVLLPIMNREIPIVEDTYVDMEFGTGVVKITPAHDPNDFEVGLRHNLPVINVLTDDAKIVDDYPKYAGMDRYEARKAIVEDLDKEGFLVKIEDHEHNVGTCYRCHTTIEPRVSKQWFVKMDEIAKPAITLLRMAIQNLYHHTLIKHISTGLKIFVIGVFPVRFGGGTGFLCGIVMLAAKLLHRALILINVRNAAVRYIRMKMLWTHGSVQLYGRSLLWAGLKKQIC